MRRGLGIGLALVLGMAAGCGQAPTGPKLAKVTGKVTFKGEPVKEGDIEVTPLDAGGTSAGAKIVDGQFHFEISPGKKKVAITAMRDVPGKFREDNPGEKLQVREQFIPSKYNAKSELELEVKADGPNEKSFDLSS